MTVDVCPQRVTGWCGWLRAAMCNGITSNELLARSGLEACLYQQWMYSIIVFIALVSFLSTGILLPLNASGNWNERQAREASRVLLSFIYISLGCMHA